MARQTRAEDNPIVTSLIPAGPAKTVLRMLDDVGYLFDTNSG